jgi:hypothetical protein
VCAHKFHPTSHCFDWVSAADSSTSVERWEAPMPGLLSYGGTHDRRTGAIGSPATAEKAPPGEGGASTGRTLVRRGSSRVMVNCWLMRGPCRQKEKPRREISRRGQERVFGPPVRGVWGSSGTGDPDL